METSQKQICKYNMSVNGFWNVFATQESWGNILKLKNPTAWFTILAYSRVNFQTQNIYGVRRERSLMTLKWLVTSNNFRNHFMTFRMTAGFQLVPRACEKFSKSSAYEFSQTCTVRCDRSLYEIRRDRAGLGGRSISEVNPYQMRQNSWNSTGLQV